MGVEGDSQTPLCMDAGDGGCYVEGGAGWGGDLAETFFDLHIAYKVEMSLDLSHISFVVNF